MRAAVKWRTDQPFDVRDDVERRAPLPGEVVVRIHAAGICQTDISLAGGAFGQVMPVVLGHEGAGVVTEVGASSNERLLGRRVVISWVPACGECFFCLKDQSQLCSNRRSAGEQPAGGGVLRVGDSAIVQGMGTATFAEEAVVSVNAVVPIDDDIDFEVAALLGCAVPTGFGAATQAGGVGIGDRVLIVGCGAVGLSALAGAIAAGAASVTAVDPQPGRREIALRLGATDALSPEQLAGHEQESAVGFDVGVDAVGNSATIRSTWSNVRRGGTAVIVGAGQADDLVSFSARELFREEKRLVGSFYGSTDFRRHISRLSALVRSERLDVRALITDTLPLEAFNEAVERQRDGSALRVMLRL